MSLTASSLIDIALSNPITAVKFMRHTVSPSSNKVFYA